MSVSSDFQKLTKNAEINYVLMDAVVDLLEQLPGVSAALYTYVNDPKARPIMVDYNQPHYSVSAKYNFENGVSTITVGPAFFKKSSSNTNDSKEVFIVSVLAHELGHYIMHPDDAKRFNRLKPRNDRAYDGLYHEGEAIALTWWYNAGTNGKNGPGNTTGQLSFKTQENNLDDIIKIGNKIIDSVTARLERHIPGWDSMPDSQKQSIIRAEAHEALVRAFTELTKSVHTSGLISPPAGSTSTTPWSETYTDLYCRTSEQELLDVDVNVIANNVNWTAYFPSNTGNLQVVDVTADFAGFMSNSIPRLTNARIIASLDVNGEQVVAIYEGDKVTSATYSASEMRWIGKTQHNPNPEVCSVPTYNWKDYLPYEKEHNKRMQDNLDESFETGLGNPLQEELSPPSVPILPPGGRRGSLLPSESTPILKTSVVSSSLQAPVRQMAALSVPDSSEKVGDRSPNLPQPVRQAVVWPPPDFHAGTEDSESSAWKGVEFITISDDPRVPQISKEVYTAEGVSIGPRVSDDPPGLAPLPPFDPETVPENLSRSDVIAVMERLHKMKERMARLEHIWNNPCFRLREPGDVSPLPTTLPCVRAHPYAFERAVDEVMEKTYRRVVRNMRPRVI